MFQNQINSLLTKLSLIHREKAQKLLSEIGLPAGQYQILAVLWQRNGQSQAEIVREVGISAPTVNSLVSKLEKAKFVKCINCSKDKRLKRVHLTAKGFDIRADAEKQWQKLEEVILKDFTDTEKILILMLLEKIKNNLQTEN